MSTIDKVVKQLSGNAQVISWDDLVVDSNGKSVDVSSAIEKTIQFSGVFGGASIRLEGSVDGENFYPLTDPQGNSLSKSGPALESVNEYVFWIRPNVSGGSKDTKLSAHLLIKFER